MTNPKKRHVVVVFDKSGSMESTKADAEGGLKSFLGELEASNPGQTLVSLFHFSDEWGVVYENVLLSAVPDYQLRPNGGTALLDAIGHTVANVGQQFARLPEEERPGVVIIVIVTDGGENSSRDYRREVIREMIEHQTNVYNWTFVFIGANQDAISTGGELGVGASASLTYDGAATRDMFVSTAAMVNRGTQTGVYAYTDAERATASGINP